MAPVDGVAALAPGLELDSDSESELRLQLEDCGAAVSLSINGLPPLPRLQ